MNLKNYIVPALLSGALLGSTVDAKAQSKNQDVKSGIEEVVNNFNGFLRTGVPSHLSNQYINNENMAFSHRLLSLANQIEDCKDPVERQRLVNIKGELLKSREILVTQDYKIPEISASLNPDTLFLGLNNLNLRPGQNYVLGFTDDEGNMREVNLLGTSDLTYFAKLEQGEKGPMIIFNENTPSGIALNGYIASKRNRTYLDSVRLNVANGIDDLANSYNEEIFRLNNLNSELRADNDSVREQILDVTNYMTELRIGLEETRAVLNEVRDVAVSRGERLQRTNWGINASYNPQTEVVSAGINADMPSGLLIKADYSTLAKIANDNAQTFDLGINPFSGLPSTRDLTENVENKYATATLGLGTKLGKFFRLYADAGLTHGQTNTLTDQLTYDMLGQNRLNVQQDQIKDTNGFSILNVGGTLGLDLGRLTIGGGVSYPVHDFHGQRPNNNLNYSAHAQVRFGGRR